MTVTFTWFEIAIFVIGVIILFIILEIITRENFKLKKQMLDMFPITTVREVERRKTIFKLKKYALEREKITDINTPLQNAIKMLENDE